MTDLSHYLVDRRVDDQIGRLIHLVRIQHQVERQAGIGERGEPPPPGRIGHAVRARGEGACRVRMPGHDIAKAGRARVLAQFTQKHIALETARVSEGLLT